MGSSSSSEIESNQPETFDNESELDYESEEDSKPVSMVERYDHQLQLQNDILSRVTNDVHLRISSDLVGQIIASNERLLYQLGQIVPPNVENDADHVRCGTKRKLDDFGGKVEFDDDYVVEQPISNMGADEYDQYDVYDDEADEADEATDADDVTDASNADETTADDEPVYDDEEDYGDDASGEEGDADIDDYDSNESDDDSVLSESDSEYVPESDDE